MKFRSLYLLLSLCVYFVCSSFETNNLTSEEQIIGSWKLTSISEDNVTYTDNNITDESYKTLVFNQDGTFYGDIFGIELTGNWECWEGTITVSVNGQLLGHFYVDEITPYTCTLQFRNGDFQCWFKFTKI